MYYNEPGGVYRIADGDELTPDLLREFINCHNRDVTSRYIKLKKAYETDYKIFHEKPKPYYKPDNRIAVNFARYIADTFTGFFMGIPVKVSSTDESINNYVNLLSSYCDLDDTNAEIAKLSAIYGHAYEILYVDDLSMIGVHALSPIDGFMIYDESITEHPRYFVHVYNGVDGLTHGSVSDSSIIRYFTVGETVKFDGEEHYHGFNGVPAVEYRFNAERQGIFEPVLSMIDEYNKVISEKANDTDYFSDAYLKIIGAALEPDDLTHIRDNRIINFDGAADRDITVEFMSKPDGDNTQEHLIERLEQNIFKVSMVPDISNDNFGTSSGIAIKYRLNSMNNLARVEERKFSAGLNRRYKLIFSNPVSDMSEQDFIKVDYKFTRNYPANELEESQIADNLSGIVSHETQLKVLSMVDDAKKEMQLIDEENAAQYSDGLRLNRTESDAENE